MVENIHSPHSKKRRGWERKEALKFDEIAEKMISNSAKEKRETSNKQKWTFAMAKQSVVLIILHEGVFYGNNKEL